MSINKTDRSFKTLINKRTTSEDKAFYEESGAQTLNIQNSEIWADSIPENNPSQAVSDGVAQFYNLFALTEDNTVANSQSWYAYSDSRLTDWISDKNGSNYAIKLYDGLNNQIFSTDALDWFFDYQTGILTINGNANAFTHPFKIDGYRYIGQKGILDGDFSLVSRLNSGMTVHVDSVNGSDVTGDGSEDNKFASIGKALSILPNSPNVAEAYYIIQLHGVGPYTIPARLLKPSINFCRIYIYGDTSDVAASFSDPVWTGTLGRSSSFDTTISPWAETITEGNFKLVSERPLAEISNNPLAEGTFKYFYNVDGYSDETTGLVRAIGIIAPFRKELDLVKLKTQIGPNTAGYSNSLESPYENIEIHINGCIHTHPSFFAGIIFPRGSLFKEGSVLRKGSVDLHCTHEKLCTIIDHSVSSRTALFAQGNIYLKGLELREGAYRFNISGCTFKGSPGSPYFNTYLLVIGGTPSTSSPGISVDISVVDFDPDTSCNGIIVYGGNSIRFFSSSRGNTFHGNINSPLKITNSSYGEGRHIFGVMKSPIVVSENSYMSGIGTSISGKIINTVNAGQEILVGADPTPYSFSNLPKNDLAQANSQFVRAT